MKRILLSAVLGWCFLISGAHAFDVPGFTPDEYVLYKTVDGPDLSLEVFYPEGHQPTDSRPAIVFFFGGGWSSGSPSQFHPHCEYLAERGMVAMSAQYRVSGTHGTTPAECVMDGKSAIRWLRNNGGSLGIDTNRVAAGGGSAGGHVAAATAALSGFNEAGEDLSTSCIPDALVLFNPVVDNGPDGYGYDRVQAYWEDFSPLHNIHAGMPPTSFYLGTNDKIIPVSVGASYQAAMQSFGLRCDLHLYDGRNHGFFNYGEPDYAETVAEMDRFLVSLGYLEEAPTRLIAVGGDNSVILSWDDSVSGDLAGYNVYRSTTSGSYGSTLVTGLTSSGYTDNSAVNDTTYYYVVTAVDTNANESARSVEVSATPEYIPDVYVNDGYDFGTDPGKVTAAAAGFTSYVKGTHTITDVADAVRFTAGTSAGPDDFAVLKNYDSLGDRVDFNITLEAELFKASLGDPLRSRYGVAMFNKSSDLHETGIDALLYYYNGNIKMYIRNGLDGAILAEQLFKSVGGSWPTGETYTFRVTGTHNGTDLDLVYSVTDGTITNSLAITVNPASYSGRLFGYASRMRDEFTVDFDRLTVAAGSDPGAPAAPSGLAAIAGDGIVWLDWNDSTEPDLDSYSVYRSTTQGTNYSVQATNLTSSAHVDNTVTNGTTYYYVVTATDTDANESAASAEVSAMPQPDNTPPAAPDGLVASAGDGWVTLDWNNNSEGDFGTYSVYRSTTSGSYSSALVTGLSANTYTDSTAVNGTTYYYAVTAVDINQNESAQSTEVSAVPEEVSGIIVFGTDNDGDGGFTCTGTNGTTRTVTTNASNVNFRAEAGGDAAFIRQFGIDRTPDTGVKYTVSGTMRINDAYADDNTRIDLLLFTDPAKALSRDNLGQVGIVWNTDDNSDNWVEGFTGGNARDRLGIYNGYNNVNADAAVPEVRRNQTVPFAQDILQGGQITMTATFWFTGGNINIDAALTDAGGVTQNGTAVVAAADFTGDYFGFANSSTVRNYDGTPNPTGGDRDNPTDIDYLSFSVESSGGEPPLTDFEQWLKDNGLAADAGAATDSDGDGMNNIYEYGLGGNPASPAVQGTMPQLSKSGNRFLYVHPQRSDDTNLIYTVETTTNLLASGSWTHIGTTVIGTNVTGGEINFVTNEVDTVESEKYLRLKIEQ